MTQQPHPRDVNPTADQFTPEAHTVCVEIPGVGPVPVASVGRRLLARLIDSVVYVVVFLVLADTGSVPSVVLAVFGALLFGLVFEWLLVADLGATLGKMALGIKVVDQRTGGLIGRRRALVRQLIPFVGALVCFVGALLVYASPLFDRSGRIQGWHDKAAHDLVVKMRNRKERSAQPEGILMRNDLDDVSDAAGDAQRAAPLASAPWWPRALTNMATAALMALVFGGYGTRPTLWTAVAFLACAIVVVVAPREVRRRGGHPPRRPTEFPRASLVVQFVTFVALFVAAILLRGFLTSGTAQAYGAQFLSAAIVLGVGQAVLAYLGVRRRSQQHP